MSTPTEAYIRNRFAEMEPAVDARDGELLVAIIGLVEADGYPELARRITDGLIEQGLNNLLARTGGAR